MKIIRALLVLSVCLLITLGVWLLGRGHSDPPATTLSSQGETDAVSNTDAIVSLAPSHETLREVRAEAVRAKRQTLQASGDSSLTNSNSPANSQDPDENREWARKFPADALAWLQTAPDGQQRLTVAEVVCPDLVQTNPVVAVMVAENCLGNDTNNVAQNLLDNLAQQWAIQDVQAASTWALTKPPGEQRDRLLQRIAFVESRTNPEQAARLTVEQMSPGPTQSEAAISVLYQWARSDSGAALAWAESFPAGDLRDRAIKEVRNAIAISSENQPQRTSPN